MAAHIPWRRVVGVATTVDGRIFLRLECRHLEAWFAEFSRPVATKCCTCDPPTFRGEPFKHSSLTHLEPPPEMDIASEYAVGQHGESV